MQETFLKLFLALPELESESAVVAWSRRTATNLCIDRYRADKRRPTMADLEVLPEEYGAECDEDYLVLAEDAAIVRDALADLPSLYRRALIAREVEELPLDVIAAQLDVEPAQMKHLLHRARRAMRRSLESRTGRAVAGLMAALLAIASLATGVRFLGGGTRNAGHIDANPLIDRTVDDFTPPVVRVPASTPKTQPKPQPRKPSVVSAPRKPAVVKHRTTHAHKPTAHTPAPVNPPANPPVVAPPVTPPPVVPPVTPPLGAVASPYVLQSGGKARPASLSSTALQTDSDGSQTSSSVLSHGSGLSGVQVNQTFSWNRDAAITGATVNLVLPTAAGQRGFLLDASTVSSSELAGGATKVVAAGVATALDGSGMRVPLALNLTFGAGRAAVLTEQVAVGVDLGLVQVVPSNQLSAMSTPLDDRIKRSSFVNGEAATAADERSTTSEP